MTQIIKLRELKRISEEAYAKAINLCGINAIDFKSFNLGGSESELVEKVNKFFRLGSTRIEFWWSRKIEITKPLWSGAEESFLPKIDQLHCTPRDHDYSGYYRLVDNGAIIVEKHGKVKEIISTQLFLLRLVNMLDMISSNIEYHENSKTYKVVGAFNILD